MILASHFKPFERITRLSQLSVRDSTANGGFTRPSLVSTLIDCSLYGQTAIGEAERQIDVFQMP